MQSGTSATTTFWHSKYITQSSCGGAIQVYEASRVAGWTDEVSKIAVEELSRLSTNFKYAVSCVILEKKGAGIDATAT